MIGTSWQDDSMRVWQFRLSHLLIGDWCIADGVQVQRIATNAFRAWREYGEYNWTVIGGAGTALPVAIRLAAHFICTGEPQPRDTDGNWLCLECWTAPRAVGRYCRECSRKRKNEAQMRHKRRIS